MKHQKIILLLAACLLLTACGKKPAEVPQTVQTEPPVTEAPTEPTKPTPKTEDAHPKADGIGVVLEIKKRGDELEAVGSFDEQYCVVKTANGYGIVEKALLEGPKDPLYEKWTGYAFWNTKIYSDYRMLGEPVRTLTSNEKVEVLDEFNGVLVVKTEKETGYVASDRISHWFLGGGDGSGGGGGGGTGVDGGDIYLRAMPKVTMLSVIEQSGSVTGKVKVRADGTRVLLGLFDQKETLKIVTEPGFAPDLEGFYTLWFGDLYGYIEKQNVRRTGEAAEEPKTMYISTATELFSDPMCAQHTQKTLYVNNAVTVVCELADSCQVKTAEDLTGFVPKSVLSDTVVYYGGGSGGGSAGSSGGGGGGDWSPPAL